MRDPLKKMSPEALRKRIESEDVRDLADDLQTTVLALSAYCRKHSIPWPGVPRTMRRRSRPRSCKLYLAPPMPPPIPKPPDGKREVTLTRQQLYDLIWSYPTTKLAAAWGHTDVGLTKWCKRYAIPKPALGDWAKMAVGQRVARPALPERTDLGSITLWVSTRTDPTHEQKTPKELRKNAIKSVAIDLTYTSPHPLVVKTRKALDGSKPGQRGLIFADDRGVLPIRVGPDSVDRALRLLDALIKACEARGMKVLVEVEEREVIPAYYDRFKDRLVPRQIAYTNKSKVHVLGEVFGFTLEETSRRHLKPALAGQRKEAREFGRYIDEMYDYVPSGELYFYIDRESYRYTRRWKDGKRQRLEDVLGEIVYEFTVIAEQAKLQRIDQEVAQRMAAEKRKKEQEVERLRMAEESRRKQFFIQVSFRSYVTEARAYVAAVADQAKKSGLGSSPEVQAWLAWASNYIDSLDPIKTGLPPSSRHESETSDDDAPARGSSYGNAQEVPTRDPFWLWIRR